MIYNLFAFLDAVTVFTLSTYVTGTYLLTSLTIYAGFRLGKLLFGSPW